LRLLEQFNGFTDWGVQSDKAGVTSSWCDNFQGLSAHIERFRNSPIMHETVPDEYKPAVFVNGARMMFPPPTKNPRVRAKRMPHTTEAAGMIATLPPPEGLPGLPLPAPHISGGYPYHNPFQMAGMSGPSTLMMQNLPDGFSRSMLTNLLNQEGFASKYDFVYLPVGFDTMKVQEGHGHAFINMCTTVDALKFMEHFNNFSQWPVPGPNDKVCNVEWHQKHQGLAPLIEKYRNSPVMHESVPEECKPLVFEFGMPIPFPQPTRKIKQPLRTKKAAEVPGDEEVHVVACM